MRSNANTSILVLLGVALALSLGSCAGEDVRKLVVADVTPMAVRDGTFQGEQDNGLVAAKVEVVVKDGAITAIRVLKHRHGPGHGADAIIDRVIAAQSLRVDAVSGATFSSKVMLKAIETAFENGMQKE
jgi:uncharacterized protein with FMN-binding domain